MFLFAASHAKFCGYNSNMTRIIEGPKSLTSEWANCSKKDQPFRLKLIWTEIDQIKDETTLPYPCDAGDRYDAAKINYLKGTLGNLEKYLSRLLKNIKVHDDYDLDMTVYRKCYQTSPVIASCGSSISFASDCNFPHRGRLFINMKLLPALNEPSDWNNDPKGYFRVLIHELCHALGITSTHQQYWYNPETESTIGINNVRTMYTAYTPSDTDFKPKVHWIVHTPNAHKYAVDRWGKEKFFNGKVPAGIEMEDGSNGEDDYSHLEMRIYASDLMTSMKIGEEILSKATLTLLQDTGWFDVDMSFAEHLAWGDSTPLGEPKYSGFPDGVQTRDFPEHLQYKYSGSYCTPLFDGYGAVARRKTDCSTTKSRYCAMKEYYDPLDYGYGDDESDYTLYMYRQTKCRSKSVHPFYGNGPNSYCAIQTLSTTSFIPIPTGDCFNMTCDNDVLSIVIGNETQVCRKENETLTFQSLNGVIYCPKPSRMCHIINYKNGIVINNSTRSHTMKRNIVISVIVVLAVLVVGAYVGIVILLKKKNLNLAEVEAKETTV